MAQNVRYLFNTVIKLCVFTVDNYLHSAGNSIFLVPTSNHYFWALNLGFSSLFSAFSMLANSLFTERKIDWNLSNRCFWMISNNRSSSSPFEIMMFKKCYHCSPTI